MDRDEARALLEKFHGHRVAVTRIAGNSSIGAYGCYEVECMHPDGSFGFEHTINYGKTWVPREIPVIMSIMQ